MPDVQEDEFFRRAPEKSPEELQRERDVAARAAETASEERERAAQARREAEKATREKAESDEREARARRPSRVLAGTFLGLSAASVVFAVVRGVSAKNAVSSLESACVGQQCPSSERTRIDDARSAAVQANIGFGLAAAFAGAGVFFLVRSTTIAPEPASAVGLTSRLRVDVGPACATLTGAF